MGKYGKYKTYGVSLTALHRMLTAKDVAEKQKDQYLFIPHADKERAIQEITGLTWHRSEYDPSATASVLAIAHMDTALGIKPPKFATDGVISAALDDRLGAYTILWELGHLPFDVLLTTGEEVGNSSAQFFAPEEHNYNWMFSFDRRGTGAVMYQYDTEELRRRLRLVSIGPEYGSFSDISYLGHLGVSGVNFGVGYNGEHSHTCYAKFHDVRVCINNFKRFWAKFKDTQMIHEEPYFKRGRGRTSYGSYYNWYHDDHNSAWSTAKYNSRGNERERGGYRNMIWDEKRGQLVESYRGIGSFRQYREHYDPRLHPQVIDWYVGGRCDLCDDHGITLYETDKEILCESCFVWLYP